MAFLLHMTWHHIRKRFPRYGFACVEIVIGMVVIACALQASMAANDRSDQIEEQLRYFTYRVCSSSGDPGDEFAVDYADVIALQTLYGGSVSFGYSCYVYNPSFQGSQIIDMYYLFMTPAYYTFFGLRPDTVYVGQSLTAKQSTALKGVLGTASFGNGRVSIEGLRCPYEPLRSAQNLSLIPSGFIGMDVPLDNAIIFPASYLDAAPTLPLSYFSLVFSTADASVADDICAYLASRHEGREYWTENQWESFQSGRDNLSRNSKLLGWMATFSLCIVSVGIIGLLMQLIQEKKRDIAICLSLGATKTRLFLEIFLETSFFCFTSAALGCVASIPILPFTGTPYYQPVWRAQSLLVCLGLTTVVTLLSCALSTLDISRISPIQTLKEL